MFKWPKTALEWVYLFWMFSSVTAVLIVIIMFGQIILLRSDIKQWDSLAFLGSIIGGSITWYGVRATIKHSEESVKRERKEKELEDAAPKIRILERMQMTLNSLVHSYWIARDQIEIHQYNPDDIVAYLRAADKTHAIVEMREIVDLSITVDAETYRAVVPLEKLLSDVDRRDRLHLFHLNTGEYKTEEVVKEMLATLLVLRRDTETALEEIKRKRKDYLRLLFPDADHQTLLLLEAL